jgi:hypothetical protein
MSSKLTALFWVRDSYLPTIKAPPLHRAVLLLLASYANPDGSRIFQSSRGVATLLGCDRSTVQDALKFWRDSGVLILVKPGNGRGHANEYRINLETECMALPFENENGVTETPFSRGNGVEGTNKRVDKGVDKRGAYATTTESPNTPKKAHTENHQRKADDSVRANSNLEKLKRTAEAELMRGMPEANRRAVRMAIETVAVHAHNSGVIPRTAQYFLTGVRNLTDIERDFIRDWDQKSADAWVRVNGLILEAEQLAKESGKDFFEVFRELRNRDTE